MQHYQEAIASFDEALAIDDSLGGAWADRGYARAHPSNEASIQPAITDFETAIHLDVDNAYTRRNLARLYVKQGRHSDAVANFKSALELDPDQPMLYFDLGLALFTSGQDAAARDAYQQGSRLLSQQPGYVREPCFQAAINDLQERR